MKRVTVLFRVQTLDSTNCVADVWFSGKRGVGSYHILTFVLHLGGLHGNK